jgi:protein involved in polysaccharide export with SLBB domain
MAGRTSIRHRIATGVISVLTKKYFSFRLAQCTFVLAFVVVAFLSVQLRGACAQTVPAGAVTATPQMPTSAITTSTPAAAGPDEAIRSDRNVVQNGHQQENRAPAVPEVRTEFEQMVETNTGRRLEIYGASLFTSTPSTFAPVSDVPVGPSYTLGPGDEIDLQLSGQVNQSLRLTVDRTGAISLPGLGAIHVSGLPYGQLNEFLTERLNRIYRNFTLNTTLGSLRTIQVFVMGQARRPGMYSISSLSTLTNAVFVSGGPLPQGSLRDIQVKREGVTIDHFDLYSLLLHGDKTHDIPLMTGDVIFIPFVGPQVAVLGSIDNPAIYELKDETTVSGALMLAGGGTAVAADASVRLERILDHSMRTIIDVPMNAAAETSVQNGDVLSLGSVTDRFRDAVTLRGNVANPGRYVWRPGMHISDLIPNRESLITRNYWRKRNQLGQLVQDYLPDSSSTTTQAEGALEVHGNSSDKRADMSSQRSSASGDGGGSSVGAALTGNSSPFNARNDVVLSAPDIYWNYAVIERQNAKDLTTSLIPFDLGKLILDSDPKQNFELLAGDVVTIFSKADVRIPSSQQTRYVRLEGEFNAAGVYSVRPGETLRGLLRRAGGLTPDAYLYASEFTRESTRRVETQRLHEYADELEAQISSITASNRARAVSASDEAAAEASAADARTAVARLRNVQPIGRIVLDLKPDSAGIDSVPDIALEDGDRFLVPRVPSNVNVQGQVYNANAFVYTPSQRVIDYLRRAGGPDREADKKRIFLLRADGSVVSRQYSHVDSAPIYPGDTIVVPPILDKRAFLQRIVDIATIVGNVGVGAATVAILARQ